MKCTGCNVDLEQGQACYETACNDFWCSGCCKPAVMLVDHAIVEDRVLVKTEAGFDFA